MIVDAHHHLWDPRTRAYPWMRGLDALARPFALADLRRETARAGVGRTVLVQAVADLAETQELLDTAARSQGLVAGVVGWVDHTRDVPAQVARLRHAGFLRGVRHQVEDEPDADWLRRPEVVAGVRSAVDPGGLVVDLLVRTDQLPAALALVDAVPDGTFVLDHAGKPPLGTGAYGAWREGVARLAERANVVCKFSGLFTLGHQELLGAAVGHLLVTFGAARLVFGTDWPVSTLALDYPDALGRSRSLLCGLSEGERSAVLGGNALRTYRLT